MARCKSCNAPIVWEKTENGKATPNNLDGSTHWSTCPHRREWRKGTAMKQTSFEDMAAPKPETRDYPG
jgi:hypothetical protein